MIRRFVNDVATLHARRWFESAGQPHIDIALRDLYRSIAQEILQHQPICTASGRCCRFEEHGHRLYVTGLEAAWCLRQIASPISVSDVERARHEGTCPFLRENFCTVHTIKPMGCRVYFCDPTARDWQRDLYERCHQTLQQIHLEFAIPYQYAEWRSLLRLCVPLLPEYRPTDWRSDSGVVVEREIIVVNGSAPLPTDAPNPPLTVDRLVQVRIQ